MRSFKTALILLQLFACANLFQALNEVDGTCNYPGEYLPDTTSCYDFYQCDSDLQPIKYTCPSGYCYNSALGYCDSPANVPCCGGSVTTSLPISTPSGVTCAFVGQLLPDPYSCTDYYQCDQSLTPLKEYCPSGFCYNSQYQYCDYPQNVPCCGGSSAAPPPPASSTEQPPVTCASVGELLPDPYSCFDFYECDENLIPVKIACQDGFCYNSAAEYCDYPENVPCCGGVLPSSYAPPTGPTSGPSPVQCTEEGELIADPTDCHSFYECDGNLDPVKFTCDPGLCFNSLTNACDFEENVPCCANTLSKLRKNHRKHLLPFSKH